MGNPATTTRSGLTIVSGKQGRELLRAAEQAHTPGALAKVEKEIERLAVRPERVVQLA